MSRANVIHPQSPIFTKLFYFSLIKISVNIILSCYLLFNGVRRRGGLRTHDDNWFSVNNYLHCMRKSGYPVHFEHVCAHSGDIDNDRSDILARTMAELGLDEGKRLVATCLDCGVLFDDSNDLAVLCREAHMSRNIAKKCVYNAIAKRRNGVFSLRECIRVFNSTGSLMQRIQAKHGHIVSS